MKKIINGKVYDTETAERIGYWDNRLGDRFSRRCAEILYRTKKGNFFIHGEGGGLSRWGDPNGDGSGHGAGIKTLTREGALLWCEQNLSSDETLKIFGAEIEVA